MNMSLTTTKPQLHESRSQHVVRTLRDIHQQLRREPDLQPRPAVNELFSSLVRTVLSVSDETALAAMDEPTVQTIGPQLRGLCARGEYELETTWARRISDSAHPQEELDQFPYLDNYRQLCRMELGVLASAVTGHPGSIAFLGSGPLPLSSLLLAQQLATRVDNFDYDPAAVALGNRMADVTNTGDVHFRTEDAANADLAEYDVVILAAMIGATAEEKQLILRSISQSMAPGALLLARSTRGLRTLLYPPVPAEALAGFEVLTVVHPVNDVINSVILARARG